MGYWHGYWGIENVGLTAEQRAVIVEELREMGPASDPSPARLNHWRTRLDGEAAIFEALWDEEKITIEAFKRRLAALFGISWVTIGHGVVMANWAGRDSAVVTFSRTGVDYMRVVFFGYAGAEDWSTWMESGDEARGYLAANVEEWEGEG
ncbi:MAG: hypothetical protein GWO24_30385 [Akkermansiaceae bacterium]|nr:hypothetical protein [Akkermansiaceae bacterium]